MRGTPALKSRCLYREDRAPPVGTRSFCGSIDATGPFAFMTRWRKTYGLVRLASRLAASSLIHPRRTQSVAERLAAFPRALPLRASVHVAWNDHQIPYIEADNDTDLAVALGAVHAHLRLAQIEIMRRIAYGRLSEAAGAVAFELDQMLRIVDFPRAVPETLAQLPTTTRTWLEGFVDGINATIRQAPARPEEVVLFGLDPKPWTVADVLAVGQLAAIDFSWRVWHRLLGLRDRPDWTHLWRRIVDAEAAPVPSLAGSGAAALTIDQFWGAFGRIGSNAAAVSAARSATGGALLSSDPHLSIMAPNSWLVAGMASPSFNIVGLMIPGLPVIALGRNQRIAWSGTSLHAASSDLFDVTDLAGAAVRERRETIHVRWSRPREIVVRETEHGPILTDSPLMKGRGSRDLALKWIGHRPSDEISAMLAMMRAQSWEDFTRAIDGFAGPAQNLVFADTTGNVGQAMAAHLPRRPAATPDDLVLHPEAISNWDAVVTARDLPQRYAPDEGFVASANDRPVEETAVPVGFFFSPDERVTRLREALRANATVTLADLAALHRDVAMPSAPAMRDLLLAAHDRSDGEAAPDARALMDTLRQWDGVHTAQSRGALAFELFLFHFLHHLHGEDGMALYRGSLQPWDLLREDMSALPSARIATAAQTAAQAAGSTFAEHRCWGDLHRIKLAHPFASMPLLGRRYIFSDVPVGGSNETLMKTAHGLSAGPHSVGFGANARFLADLGAPDENYVVLLGGQDGWLGSTTFDDQFDLWQRGDYCRLPLRPETARAEFAHHLTVQPTARSAPSNA